jgi:hydroxyacylglutathione hydrolase
MFGYYKDNIGYVLNDQKTKTLIGIDFGEYEQSKKIVEILEEFTDSKLKYILTTHSHWDHCGGNKSWKAAKKDEIKIISGDTKEDQIPFTDIFLQDEEEINFGDLNIKCIHTPGHIGSHVCYFISDNNNIESQNFIFTGDLLFSAGCGRVFSGTHEQMHNSLNRVKKFPLNTMVFCGHEYTLNNLNFALSLDPENEIILNKINQSKNLINQGMFTMGSTIKDEITYNPFLRTEDNFFKEKFSLDNSLEIFTKLRNMKDRF